MEAGLRLTFNKTISCLFQLRLHLSPTCFPLGVLGALELAFLTEPRDVIAVRDWPLMLHCQVEGEGPISITWRHNGVPVVTGVRATVLENGTLLIKNFSKRRESNETDAGEYDCAAQNRYGLLISRKARVQLASLPKFLSHPQSLAVDERGVARLSCQVNGIPEAHITWQKDRHPLSTADPRYTLLPNGVLQITSVQRSDNGLFRCVASNIANTRYSHEAQLSVTVAGSKIYKEPVILSGPQNLTINVHQTAILECIATGNPRPIVSWSRLDGRSIGVEGVQVLGTGNLMISDATLQHSGVYVCSANRPGSRSRRTALGRLVVQVCLLNLTSSSRACVLIQVHLLALEASYSCFIVKFSSLLSTSDPPLGACESARLCACVSENKEDEEIHCQVKVQKVSTVLIHQFFLKFCEPLVFGWTHSILDVKVSGAAEDGELKSPKGARLQEVTEACVSQVIELPWRQAARGETAPVSPPEFVQWPQSVSRPAGGSAVFSCTATGVPEPHLIWLKNGKLLTPSGNVKLTNGNTTLAITRITPEDEAIYQCIAENIAGTNQASARLAIVQGPELPDAPTGLRAATLSSNSLQITWDPPEPHTSQQIIGYVLHIRRLGAPSTPSFFTKVLNQTAMQVYWELPSKPGKVEGFRLEYSGVSNPDIQGQEIFPGHINTHTISHLGEYELMTSCDRRRLLPQLTCDRKSERWSSKSSVFEIGCGPFNGNGDSPPCSFCLKQRAGPAENCNCNQSDPSMSTLLVGVHSGLACILCCLLFVLLGYRRSKEASWEAPPTLNGVRGPKDLAAESIELSQRCDSTPPPVMVMIKSTQPHEPGTGTG
ncbi:hypothetical protein CRENBAI_003025 [Crenichthys baileyi]|uniref:Uncharacterized protein n=1 Tax=Crenichthys baileyi TaxID=28760 RepID=A0AAV9RVD2_9TELE